MIKSPDPKELDQGLSSPSKEDADSTGRDAGTVEFRVITHHNTRHALKLEHIFWKVLELAAKSCNQRPGAYLGTFFEKHDSKANLTSAVRVHAVEWLSRKLVEASSKSISPRILRDLIQTIPLPCFCVDNKGQIIDQNSDLLAILQPLVAQVADSGEATVHVAFKRDVTQVRDDALKASGGYLVETVVIKSSGGAIEHKARVVGIKAPQDSLLGLFVLLIPHDEKT